MQRDVCCSSGGLEGGKGRQQSLPGSVVTEPQRGSAGDGGPAGTGLALLECAACSKGGELRRMEFHRSEKSPSRPCPASCSREGGGWVLSLPALPRLVWVFLGAGFPPCPGCRRACESGDTRDLAPGSWGGAQIRLTQLCSSPPSRGPLAYLTR